MPRNIRWNSKRKRSAWNARTIQAINVQISKVTSMVLCDLFEMEKGSENHAPTPVNIFTYTLRDVAFLGNRTINLGASLTDRHTRPDAINLSAPSVGRFCRENSVNKKKHFFCIRRLHWSKWKCHFLYPFSNVINYRVKVHWFLVTHRRITIIFKQVHSKYELWVAKSITSFFDFF